MSNQQPSGISRICQEGRTNFLENLIDTKLEELQDLTDRLHRWPIPRPLLMKQRKRALQCLGWLSNQLHESTLNDQQLVYDAEQIAQKVVPVVHEVLMPLTDNPVLVSNERPALHYDTAAQANLAVVEDR